MPAKNSKLLVSAKPFSSEFPQTHPTRREDQKSQLKTLNAELALPVDRDTKSGAFAHLKMLGVQRALLKVELQEASDLGALDLGPPHKMANRKIPTMREIDRLAAQVSDETPAVLNTHRDIFTATITAGDKPVTPEIVALARQAENIYRTLRTGPNPGINASYIKPLKDAPIDGGFVITLEDGATIAVQEFNQARLSLQSASKPVAFATQIQFPSSTKVKKVTKVNIGCAPSPHAFNAPATLGNVANSVAVENARIAKDTMSFVELSRSLASSQTPGAAVEVVAVNGMANIGAVAAHANITPFVAIQPGTLSHAAADTVSTDLGEFGRQHHFRKLLIRLCARPDDTAGMKSSATEQERYSTYVKSTSVSTDVPVFDGELRDSDGNLKYAHLAVEAQQPAASDAERIQMGWDVYASYISACATRLSLNDMAVLYNTLSNRGFNRYTHEQVLAEDVALVVLEQMRVGGLYQASPAFTEQTGLVAKTGVSGTGNFLSPLNANGRKGPDYATFSPPLDANGNSWLGLELVRQLQQWRAAQLSALV